VSLNNLAAIAMARGEFAQADACYARSLAIKERALGPNHPELATTVNNLAVLRERQRDFATAAALFERAHTILAAALPADHPHVVACHRARERVLQKVW
jgi:Flp pilus assembly protein TadD